MKTEAKLKVYYDGLCKVCKTEMNHYQKQMGADRMEFIDICSTQFDAAAEGLDPFQVHKVMHVRRLDGSLAIKVDAFIEIWKTLPKYHFAAQLASKSWIRRGLDTGYILFTKIRPWLPRNPANADCSNSPYCEVKNA